MINNLVMIVLVTVCICAVARAGSADLSAEESGNPVSTTAGTISTENRIALDLGRKVLAIRQAIENPMAPDAMHAVTDLGHDQRYYVLVRGWLSYQLQGDISILDANREQTSDRVKERISFLKQAIRTLDLE